MRTTSGRTTWSIVLCLSVAAQAGSGGVAPGLEPRHHFLEPSEIMKRMEASPVQYAIKSMDQLDVARGKLAETMWPARAPELSLPRVVKSKGGAPTVVEVPEPPGVHALLETAEEAYRGKDFAGAEAAYRAALVKAPNFYILHAYLGDALLFGGDAAGALAAYDRALALNPDDSRLYFFRSTARRHLHDDAGWVADLRQALTLKPRSASVVTALQQLGPGAPVHLEPDVLVPRGFARREGDAVVVYADVGGQRAEWLAWANCKALWLGEASHRREMLGQDAPQWSTVEETECLASLVAVYASRRERGEGERDERLERLVAVAKDGLTAGLVIYEIGSRVDPHLVLRLDDRGHALVRRYVEKYVLPTVTPPAATRPPAP